MSHSRRDFTRGLAAASIATALSARRVAGANERIGFGIIGCGARGQTLWKNFIAESEVDPVAVCDLYQPYLQKGLELSNGRANSYKDFRKLLDDKHVQAVIIATPDHWHALMAVAALRAGKDVYIEKPLSLVVSEGRSIIKAAREHKRVVQVGSQQRSGVHYEHARQLIREGKIGDIHHVEAGHARNVMPGFRPKDLPVDATNPDWDMWLGPAPKVPFDRMRCLYNFRWFWDYSGGQMTNYGAHHLDIVRWYLGAKGPTSVVGFGSRYAINDGGETPDVQHVVFQFPGCVTTWTTRELSKGDRAYDIEFHGTLGTLAINRSGFKLTTDVWEGDKGGPSSAAAPPRPPIEEKGGNLDQSHITNFLACLKSRARPNADVEEGHLSATMCHLGNIATRLGRQLRWDPAKESFIGDAEANRWLTKAYRKPWSLASV